MISPAIRSYMRIRCLHPVLLLTLFAAPARAQEPNAPAKWEVAALGGFRRGESITALPDCVDTFLTPGAEVRRSWRYGFVGGRGTFALVPKPCDLGDPPPPHGAGIHTRTYWRGEVAPPLPHLQTAAGVQLDHPAGVRYTLQALAGVLPVQWREEIHARPTVSALVGLRTVAGRLSVEGGCTWDRAIQEQRIYEGSDDPQQSAVLVSHAETAHWPRLCGAGVRWRVSGV